MQSTAVPREEQVLISAWVDPSTAAAFRARAQVNDRSMSAELRRLIRVALSGGELA